MNYHNDDHLDRALFALPLEEPPEGLREAILASTVYRPAPPFTLWEAWAVGVATAVMVWLIVEISLGGAARFVQTFDYLGSVALRGIDRPSTLLWVAIGICVSMWVSSVNLELPVLERARRR
jgi:hypothetical protein